MSKTQNEDGKKLPRIRRLSSLGAIRKELVRVYEECREDGPNPERVQFYRALAFILNTAAQVKKDESLDLIEERLEKLEEARK